MTSHWGPAIHWLCLEGLLPLLGAGALYTIIGVVIEILAVPPFSYKFPWKNAIDPMGWLYGAAFLSVQAGFESLKGKSWGLTGFCFAVGFFSLAITVGAMSFKGVNSSWAPSWLVKSLAVILLAVSLVAGFRVHLAAGN